MEASPARRLAPSANGALPLWIGPGASPAVVLLHGGCGNALWWERTARALPGRRIVAPDLPGHGAAPPAEDWSLVTTAKRVREALRDEFGDEPAIWGGHSWGGKVSAVAAGLFGAEVAGLLLIDPSPIPGIPELPVEDFVDAVFVRDLGPWPDRTSALRELRDREHLRPAPPDIEVALLHGLESDGQGGLRVRPGRAGLVALCEEVLRGDYREVVGNPSCPTLLVTASESEIWQKPTNVAALPGAEHVSLPGNHWIHLHAAERFESVARAWLDRHWPVS